MKGMGMLGVWLLLGACEGGDENAEPTPPMQQPRELGRACDVDDDCASGTCLGIVGLVGPSAFCSQPCATDDDCSGLAPVCGLAPDGGSVCAFACSGIHYGFACVDDMPIACGLDETLCDQCGCGEGRRCDPGVGCAAQSDEGGPCTIDADCTTHNCSASAEVCRVAVGTACTESNCDECLRSSNDEEFSYCSRACLTDPQCDDGLCLWDGTSGACVQRCEDLADESCPGACQVDPNSDLIYCAL